MAKKSKAARGRGRPVGTVDPESLRQAGEYLTIRLRGGLAARLRDEAKRIGIAKSELARRLLERGLGQSSGRQ